MKTNNLIVKSKLENLFQIRNFIRNCFEGYKIKQEIIDQVAISVDELCTNIIEHGYHLSPDNFIEITLNIHEENNTIEIIIKDFSVEFNPNRVPSVDIKEYFKQRKVGGLGIHLVKNLMDKIEYNHITEAGDSSSPLQYNLTRLIKSY